MAKGVLYVVASATGAARDVSKLVELAVSDGWDVWVVGTPNSAAFLKVSVLEALTGLADDEGNAPHPPRTGGRRLEGYPWRRALTALAG